MTLFDCAANSSGKISSVGGDVDVHGRLVDLGLLDTEYAVRAKRKSAVLADFGGRFSATVAEAVARQIEVIERNL